MSKKLHGWSETDIGIFMSFFDVHVNCIPYQANPKAKTTTQIPPMKALKPALNRRTSGNGHSRFGHGHTNPGRMQVAEAASTPKNSVTGYKVRLAEGAPEMFTIEIRHDRRPHKSSGAELPHEKPWAIRQRWKH